MKVLFVGIFIILISHCNLDTNRNSEDIIPKTEVLKNINILRQAGFFKEHENKTDTEVYDEIYKFRKELFSKYTGRIFDPGMNISLQGIAECDEKKMIVYDLEADVSKYNKVYVRVIEEFSKLSKETFNPHSINENWKSDKGPIEVSFISEDTLIKFNPDYNDDWLDDIVFDVCLNELIKRNIRVANLDTYEFAIMQLSEEEQRILETKFDWEFSLFSPKE